MIRAIILTHGTLGAALMKSVESILGPQQEAIVLSNSGKALDQIVDSVEPYLEKSQTLIFVDFCGGSPFMACKMLKLSPDSAQIVSGVNLPMLLSFFTKRDKLNFQELTRVVQDDGHRGIQLHCE
jgi:mannose/fructose-specific phosphotransferase system component IIA